MINGGVRRMRMGMDDHSPARRERPEPDPETAERGARDRAASDAMSAARSITGELETTGTNETSPATSPPAQDSHQSGGGAAAPERRSGNDERQRGWFWHWNGIVTQFAPLIGLKGIGLLNSYTVWTDRREDSPHRGYAFPSQQAEANFYGEDRAELITINKILVALDLIEIRKEMVLKVDEQGRRWRVPHNFYRVKDRPNGLDLTADDVIRVIELAERDAAVYRYIRKVFSTKFEPIDRDNVWHRILPEVASHPAWQRLAEKAARQEARASARTRAGHRARGKKQRSSRDGGEKGIEPGSAAQMTSGHDGADMFGDGQQDEGGDRYEPTSVADSDNGSSAGVAPANSGFETVDEEVNNGSTGAQGTSVAAANIGGPGVVEPGNTTHYKLPTTTTTTTSDQIGDSKARAGSRPGVTSRNQSTVAGLEPDPLVAAPDRELVASDPGGKTSSPGALASDNEGNRAAGGSPPQRGAAPASGQGPVGDPSPLVVSLFEAANDRRATPLERILLSELESDAAAAAQAAGSTGAEWVAAALREAVGSGSSFVAPKRIREIINRWASQGAGPRGAGLAPEGSDRHALESDPASRHAGEREQVARRVLTHQLDEMLGMEVGISSVTFLRDGGEVELVARVVGVSGSALAGCRPRLERVLARELGRPVTLRLSASGETGEELRSAERETVYVISPADATSGRQLWLAVLDDLSTVIPASDLARLRDVTVLGQGERGEVYLGVTNRLASRYLSGRYRDAVRRSLDNLLSSATSVVVLDQDQWRIDDSTSQ